MFPVKQQKIIGFTIVELLIVIVVVGILAAIVIVAYNGVQNNARLAVLKNDLTENAKTLKASAVVNSDNYPTDTTSATTNGLKTGAETNVTYVSSSTANPSVAPKAYCLQATYGPYTYYVSSATTTPSPGTCGPIDCPTGFIPVPGNANFSTSDFCVSKYEAKTSGASIIIQPSGTLYENITQTTAITSAQTVCTGCHVPTEAEWMTIAANVLSVPSNWSGNAVGSGYIFSGHSDNVPNTDGLSADTNDDNGYFQEITPAANQKRTLILTNGMTIWDMAGNLWEWTQGTVAGNSQPGIAGEVSYTQKEWSNPSLVQRGLPLTSFPNTISAQAATWTSAQGVGKLSSNYSETAVHSVYRGGSRNNGSLDGVLATELYADPSTITFTTVGMRVTR